VLIEAAGIELAPVQDGKLVTRILAPGTMLPRAESSLRWRRRLRF
jgi:hypothetical protein